MNRNVLLAVGLFVTLVSATPVAPVALKTDLSERTLTVFENGEPVETYMVAIGKKSYPTPTGQFKIRKIVWNPDWVPPNSRWAWGKKRTPSGHPDNPMKVAKIFFREPDYYIHGTDKDFSIGERDSHGCLRLTESDVKELGRYLMERGGRERDDSWYATVLGRKSPTVVRLRYPIPLTIEK